MADTSVAEMTARVGRKTQIVTPTAVRTNPESPVLVDQENIVTIVNGEVEILANDVRLSNTGIGGDEQQMSRSQAT